MKKSGRMFLLAALMLAALVMSACSGASPANQTSKAPKVQSNIIFTGTIEAINGNQWTINGQTITVDPSVVSGTFNVGDTVTVEASVAQDGSVIVREVKPAADNANSNENLSDNSNDNEDDSNINDNGNENDDNRNNNDNSNDSGQNEVVGVVTAIDSTSITVDGVVYSLDGNSEVKDTIQVGDTVKIEFVTNADGSLTVSEVEVSSEDENDNGNSNDNENSNEDDHNDNANSNDNKQDDSKDGGGDD